jgi:hypothetical protein
MYFSKIGNLLMILILQTTSFFGFNVRTLQMPIFNQIPVCINHHALLISESDDDSSGIYFVDYTPITAVNESVQQTQLKLLLGKTLPAEVRIRYIKNAKIFEDDKILNAWDILDIKNPDESQKLSDLTYNAITNKKIKEFISNLIEKNKLLKINLYTNNCQHFCRRANKVF